MHRGVSFALIASLGVALLGSVLMQVWALPAAVSTTVAVFPEVRPIVVPSITWGVIAIACWQVTAVLALRIIVLARNRSFGASAYGLVRAMASSLVTYVLLAVFAHIALSALGRATAGVVVGLFGSGLLALVIAGTLAYLLLTRAVPLRYTRSRHA